LAVTVRLDHCVSFNRASQAGKPFQH